MNPQSDGILIAGGAGLLGSAVALRLSDEGYRTVAADLFDDSGDGAALKEDRARLLSMRGVSIVRGDLSNPDHAAAVLETHHPTAIVQAAIFPRPGDLQALLSGSLSAGVSSIVHLSDSSLYGPAPEPGRRACEDEPLPTDGDPALACRASEEEAVRGSGLSFTILRVFELIGPHMPVRRFPTRAMEALLAGKEVLLDDDAPRDFIHVDDAARGVFLALAIPPAGKTLNLGTGQGVPPSALIRGLATRLGRDMPTIRVLGRAARAPRIADMERVWTTLGFAPGHTLPRILDEIASPHSFGDPSGVERVEPARQPAAALPPSRPREVSRRELFGFFRGPRG